MKLIQDYKVDFEVIKNTFPMIYVTTGGGSINDVEAECETSFKLISIHSVLKLLKYSISKYSLTQLIK